MQYHFDVVDTLFGKFFILDSSKGLHYLIKNSDPRVTIIKKKFLPIKNLFNSSLKAQLEKYLNGKHKKFSCKIGFLTGTDLQKQVWTQLLKLSYGKTISYSQLALRTPYQKAIRAVASAVGKNPIGIIVPCHRVIAKDGSLGGYAWGVKMKAKLLDMEVSGMADSTYRGGK
jgi:O-6-methylguanine DNA methyltransferase